jgi:hypothetical protein
MSSRNLLMAKAGVKSQAILADGWGGTFEGKNLY